MMDVTIDYLPFTSYRGICMQYYFQNAATNSPAYMEWSFQQFYTSYAPL